MDYKMMSDEQLISMLREGQSDIMDFLMEKYKGTVRMFARELFLLGGENDDLIQEGMIGLFKGIRDFRPDGGASFSSFARMCILRQMDSAIKAAKRQKHSPLNSYVSLYSNAENAGVYGENLPLVETLQNVTDNNPESLIISAENAKNIQNELRKELSKMENKVLTLHLLGLERAQIAEIMEKSPKAVDNALLRIRDKLKKILKKIPL